ncbi:MAG TPA: metallophosphoesterase [Anaeromyxobacteraceae bacterium]|nr:metallophosphoesterase [Anaeromyxobacteraceae bacterium]
MTRRLAHISDLHLGRDAVTDAAAARLCASLAAARLDHVVLTGDVTHRGLRAELRTFERLFAPLLESGRLTVVPGNHDRLGDDVAARLMPGERVRIATSPGVFTVAVDSTVPQDRSLLADHGWLTDTDLDHIDRALDAAPPGALRVLALHHHLLPAPEDGGTDRSLASAGWSHAAEAALGTALIGRLLGWCEVVLHGHRHAAARTVVTGPGGSSLTLFNAGATTELEQTRILRHRGGRLLAEEWLHSDAAVGGAAASRALAVVPPARDAGLAA